MLRPEEAYEGYERAWNEPGRAASLLEKVWASEGVYADDDVPDGVVGPAALAALIVETHEALPGFRVWATSAPRMLAERMAITWAGEGGDPPIPQAGTDVIESALTAGSPASRTCSTSTDQAGGDSPASSRGPGASPQLLS